MISYVGSFIPIIGQQQLSGLVTTRDTIRAIGSCFTPVFFKGEVLQNTLEGNTGEPAIHLNSICLNLSFPHAFSGNPLLPLSRLPACADRPE